MMVSSGPILVQVEVVAERRCVLRVTVCRELEAEQVVGADAVQPMLWDTVGSRWVVGDDTVDSELR